MMKDFQRMRVKYTDDNTTLLIYCLDFPSKAILLHPLICAYVSRKASQQCHAF